MANQPVKGALEVLDCPISAGADVDACEDLWFDGHPPTPPALVEALSAPALPGSGGAVISAMAMKLIEAGANFNAHRADTQERPLDLAATRSSLELFKALIAKGADPSPTPYVTKLILHGHAGGFRYALSPSCNHSRQSRRIASCSCSGRKPEESEDPGAYGGPFAGPRGLNLSRPGRLRPRPPRARSSSRREFE